MCSITLKEKKAESNKKYVGNGDSSDGKSKWKVYDTTQDSGVLPTIAVTLWLGWMGFDICTIIYLIVFAGTVHHTTVLCIVLAVLLLPPSFPSGFGFRLGQWMVPQARKYFGLKTTVEDEEQLVSLSKSRTPMIFAHEPHGILPFPMITFSPYLHHLRFLNCSCLVTSAVFYVPFVRQIYSWTHCESVDKATFQAKLQRKENFVFCPGGVQEVTMMDPTQPDDVLVYLKTRKGFIKLALASGTPIVPSFAFNMDGCYGYWIPGGKLVNKVARAVGVLPMAFWGRFGVPFGIPKPQRIQVVIGKVIHIPKEDEVSKESVDKWHGVFLREIEALYDRHKEDAGYGHRKLKIV